MSDVNNNEDKTWLQRLKEESWEAELLVSAVATFSAFQLFILIEWATNKLIDLLLPEQYFFGYIIVYLGLLAVSLLVTMFVIHFILRSYWVGLVGLNSVFPEYGLEKSAYSKLYTQKLLSELPSLKYSIERVDELCSVIFSSAFALLMVYSYSAILLSPLLVLYSLFFEHIPVFIPFTLATLAVAIVAISLLAQMPRYKESERFQTLYFKSVKFSSIVFLGPFYKASMQIHITFGSNYHKNKQISRLLLLFICVGVGLSMYKLVNSNLLYLIDSTRFENSKETYPSFYKNHLSQPAFLLTPQIQSEVIQNSAVSLFIPVFAHEKRLLDSSVCGNIESDENLSRKEKRNKDAEDDVVCYEKYHTVSLNDVTFKSPMWIYKQDVTGQLGISTFISLDDLEHGYQVITITKHFTHSEVTWHVPFYYAK